MEKLNCKSLMIGDWVSYGETFIKVGNVYEDCINFQHDIPFVQEEFLIEQTEIEPIPLTQEILEKNGFVFLSGLWYLITKERKPIYIVFKDNNVITLSINATPFPIGLKYVHQLQHALRLCGIEKEIEL